MLRHIHVETTLFGPGESDDEARTDLMWLLEALVQRNQDYLKQHPNTPRLYRSGVKYMAPKQFDGECEEAAVLRRALGSAAKDRNVREILERVQAVFGGEHFCDIGVIRELGGIDCDGMACWRVAELRQAGIKARPYVTWRERLLGGGTIYHALVRWPAIPGIVDENGVCQETTEDPSLLLGMSQPDRAADRQEEIRKNKERCEVLSRKGVQNASDLFSPASPLDQEIEDVLGLRRRRAPQRRINLDAMAAELNNIFGGKKA